MRRGIERDAARHSPRTKLRGELARAAARHSSLTTAMDASRSAGPAPVTNCADTELQIALPAMQNAKRQRHVRTAVRQRQRHCICIDMARHVRRGAALVERKIAARMQRRRGEVELVRGEPTWSTGEMRHQRQRTVAQPVGQARAGPPVPASQASRPVDARPDGAA